MGPKARLRFLAKQLPHKRSEDAFQLAKGDMRIHEQALHLMEHWRVRYIVIDAVSLPRHNDTHRRLLPLHHTNLHRRCVRPQEMPIGEVERIVQIARGMVCRGIQCVEVVIICLDLGARNALEAQLCENRRNLLQSLRNRVRFAVGRLPTGERDVHRLVYELFCLLLTVQFSRCLIKRLSQFGANLVRQFADNGPFGFGQFAHAFHHRCQLAVASKVLNAERFKCV